MDFQSLNLIKIFRVTNPVAINIETAADKPIVVGQVQPYFHQRKRYSKTNMY